MRSRLGSTPASIATAAIGSAPNQIRQWAENGIQTVHCHNDGDAYGDGLFWRDGSYPPYPDMEKYDQVIADCHKVGIRVAHLFLQQGVAPEHRRHSNNTARIGAA